MGDLQSRDLNGKKKCSFFSLISDWYWGIFARIHMFQLPQATVLGCCLSLLLVQLYGSVSRLCCISWSFVI